MTNLNCSIGSIRMNDEDQEVPLYNEIFQYLKHGEYRVDASKSEKRAIRRRAHSFVKKACSISKAIRPTWHAIQAC